MNPHLVHDQAQQTVVGSVPANIVSHKISRGIGWVVERHHIAVGAMLRLNMCVLANQISRLGMADGLELARGLQTAEPAFTKRVVHNP